MRYASRSLQQPLQGGFITHRASSPYPQTYQDLPEDMDDWTCAQWDIYKDRQIKYLGLPGAIKQVNKDSDEISPFATGHWCRYDCDWQRKWEKQGFDTGGNIFTNVFCAGEAVTAGVGNIGKTFQTLTNPWFLIPVGLAVVGFYGYNKGWFD